MGKLFGFNGRVGRSAYWLSVIASVVFYGIFVAWQATLDPWNQPQTYTYSGETKFYWHPTDEAKLLYGLFALVGVLLILIGLSVGARRWHDHGKSGWWSLISIIPIVGSLYVFVMLAFVAGEGGPNRYGDAS